jgi:hypothetical protein
MEAVCSYETSVSAHKTTRHHSPENHYLKICENLVPVGPPNRSKPFHFVGTAPTVYTFRHSVVKRDRSGNTVKLLSCPPACVSVNCANATAENLRFPRSLISRSIPSGSWAQLESSNVSEKHAVCIFMERTSTLKTETAGPSETLLPLSKDNNLQYFSSSR